MKAKQNSSKSLKFLNDATPHIYFAHYSQLLKIMQEIKDQQRLFEKLFISPNSTNPNPHLILSMQFLKLLLDEASLLSSTAQKPFLLKILGLFEIQPVNSLMLYYHDSLAVDQTSLLAEIILTCARSVKSREQGEEYLSMIDSLIAYYPIGLQQISNITRQFAIQFQNGKFQATKTRFLHRVLEKYYGNKQGLKGMPQSFFFFFGCSETSTIHSFQDIKLKIKNQFSILISFYFIEKPQKDIVICRLKTNKQQICVRVGKWVSVQNQITKQKVHQQQNLKAQTWYRVIVSLSSNETTIQLNDELIVRERAIIKRQKQREIYEYSFGQELFGFMTGIALTHKTIPPQIMKDLPVFKNWYDISSIRKHNLQEYFILSCFPFSTFQMRQSTHCFDIFQRIHSQIGQNIILFTNYAEYAGLTYMGNSEILLPLFYLARFYNVSEYPDQLACLLKIWLASTSLFPTTQKNQNFLLILGHHFQFLPQQLTSQSVTILNILYEKQSPNSKILFLKHISWSGLPCKTSSPVTLEWLNWLTRIYQNSKSLCLQAFGLLDVVYWLVIHLQNNFHYCCPQHYLSEARVLRQFSIEEMTKLEKNSKRIHFEAAENIAAVILQYYIIDQHRNSLKDIKGILRLLLHKYSTCLYRTILRIFRRQFPKFKDDRALSLFFQEAGLIPFLAALAQKTVDAGLLSLIVFLLLTISTYRQNGKQQAIDFLVVVFRRMHEIYQQHFNPIAYGAKKVRKHSTSPTQAQGYTALFQRMNQYRQDMTQLAIVLLNFCVGQLQDAEISKHSRIVGQPQLYLLRCFMPLAGSDTRTFILEALKSKLQQNFGNIDYCSRSVEFNQILISGLRQSKEKQRSAVKRILIMMFSWQITQNMLIGEYYTLLKTVSKSQIDLSEILIQIFNDILIKHQQISLYYLQIILLISTTEHRQAINPNKPAYFKLMSQIASSINSIIKKQLHLQEKYEGTLILKKLTNLLQKQKEIIIFNFQINLIPQQNINFLFDIFLPKAIAGYNTQTLFTDCKRRVYGFQILMWSLLDLINQQSQETENLAKSLVQMLKIFISVNLIKSEAQIDKSFLRMTLFLTSYSLCFSPFKKYFLQLWMWILKLTQLQIKQLQATSYIDLINKLASYKIQPYLVELFETFLRPNNDQYLLNFETLAANNQAQFLTFLEENLIHIIKGKSFSFATAQCKQYAFNEMNQMFSERTRIVRLKIDVQVKKNPQHWLFKQVQKLFEEESVGEQETRLRYLHQHECSIREYYSKWKKIWKRLRIYHHPYGLFMAQKDTPNSFQYKDVSLKNFRLKISKFSSKSGIQPILQAQILQPWHVRKVVRRDGKNQLSSLVQMTRPTHNPRKRQGNITEFATNVLRTLRGQKKKYQTAQYEVIWIKRGRKARGKLLISDQWQLIFWYDSLKQEDCHLSFERFILPFDKVMIKKWRIDLIRSINLRRYLMQWHALQLQLIYQKSLLFFFCDGREQHFLNQIQQMRSVRQEIYGYKLKLNKINLYSDEWYCEGLPPTVTENWLNYKISTLTYLISINKAASRSILDVSQYPVAPWVCSMSEQKQPNLRDLSKTMGALGNEERKKIVQEKYQANDPFNPVPPFFFGTHYSSPGVVFNYLIRVAPFTDYCKNLQGGKFDIADRLFASLITAWKSASNQVSDVREMIPEFYYLPETLLNLENLHLGQTQSGEAVNHVELPPWAGGNPYFLTIQLRQILESDATSTGFSSWLDLIFGVKQKGKQAIENFNVYYYLTYEEYSNCLENNDEVYRKSCEAQIVHFGQIPPQIFDIPQVRRAVKVKVPTQLVIRQKIQLMNILTERPIGVLKISSSQLMLIKRNEIQTLFIGKSPAIMIKSVEFNLERTISKKLYNLKKQTAKCIFFYKYFLIYGYVTNEFRIFSKNSGTLQYNDNVDSTIETAMINNQESLLLIGCRSGLLHIYELEYEPSKVLCKLMLTLPFPHSITHISEHDGFYAITFGCYVSIYKFQRGLSFLSKESKQLFVRFFRSFKNTLPVRGAYIADAPLYCLFMYDKAHAKVYSINGQFIRSFTCNPRGVTRMQDSQLNSLFCLHEDERLVLLSTPDLRCISELEIKGATQVVKDSVVYKKEIHLIDCGNV